MENQRDRIKLNVGGKLFETTIETLQSGGPDSLLWALSSRPNTPFSDPIFIDRDPEIFAVLLSLLRTNRLPSSARNFSKQELSDEALYYGIDSPLRFALSPPSFSGIDASIVSTVFPAADGTPTTFSAGEDGSVWIAHGGQISSFDWTLSHAVSVRTHLERVTSVRRVLPEVVAVGSESDAGLHFYDSSCSTHVGSVHWTDPSDPRVYKARVTSLADSDSHVFAAFDCLHRENSVLSIDKNTLRVVSEFGRQSGSSTRNVAPGKLTWLPESGLVVGSAVKSGAFGCSGYIRIWDPRMGSVVVWETNEPGSGRRSRYGDSFADVEVDVETSLIFKVGSKSGELAVADLRNLREDPWVYVKDKNPGLNLMGGESSVVMHCYKGQVFVGRDGALEVWSRVAGSGEELERIGEGLYRRNFVDKVEDSQRGFITKIEGGGDRLFVSREGVEGIEVWESSFLSGVNSVS